MTPNRSVASSAATAREVRWKTATAYAATATPHTAQDRLVAGDGARGVSAAVTGPFSVRPIGWAMMGR